MQIRRVLLLFALVLGLSALVASIAPPPEDQEDEAREQAAPAAEPVSTGRARAISLRVRPQAARPATRRVRTGSSFSLEVSVPAPGDVLIEGLGLRQSADPLTPARFALLAEPRGRHAVTYVPIDGERRLAGRLEFVDPATVTRSRRDR